MKVAAVQMVSSYQPEANLRAVERLLAQAADSGAELVLLPEYFCLLGQRDTDKLQIQETQGSGPIQSFLADCARRHRIWLAAGSMPLATSDPAKVRNSLLVFGPDGAQVARYDKIHLFRFRQGQEQYDETRVLEPGDSPQLVQVRSRSGETLTLGLSICYDLRFPELYRYYSAHGADVLLVPSAFTYTTGQVHWELLLRARAVENLAWVLAAAQGGQHDNGRRTWGHSMVVDPWGQVVAQRETGEGLVLADLDLATLHSRRAQLPALDHRLMESLAL